MSWVLADAHLYRTAPTRDSHPDYVRWDAELQVMIEEAAHDRDVLEQPTQIELEMMVAAFARGEGVDPCVCTRIEIDWPDHWFLPCEIQPEEREELQIERPPLIPWRAPEREKRRAQRAREREIQQSRHEISEIEELMEEKKRLMGYVHYIENAQIPAHQEEERRRNLAIWYETVNNLQLRIDELMNA